ncbi:hypothetical protein GCM10023211_08870 [Orbus sasakiae]|uniref:Toxin-antitoxin system YwqK family antitoxin n=1 Tax=Orbus sasakiae TaxID=1078475 RepID=A0ABP9N2B0_9GAMM
MKIRTLILILFSFILFSCNQEKTVSTDQLQMRKGVLYLINEKDPFTGKAIRKNTYGQIVFEGNYEDGKQEGIQKAYYDDGSIKLLQYYENGKKEGEQTAYGFNGRTEYNYKNGRLDGVQKTYDHDGNLVLEENYKNGQLNGKNYYR